MQVSGHMAATAPRLTPKKKSQSKPLLVGVLLLAVAGAGYWFYRTKMHPAAANAATTSTPPAASTAIGAITLDPFLANLSGGQGYVKVTITLSVRKPAETVETGKAKAVAASAESLRSAIVRDTILADLSTQTAATLLTAEGKAALKTTLKQDLVAKVPGLALDNLYFTDFLVQQ
jgi:flagellar basal body-associated protein FliL